MRLHRAMLTGAIIMAAFMPGAQAQVADSGPVAAAPAPVATGATGGRDAVLWNTIRDTGYLELYEFFLNKYPASAHAAEARLTIAILKGEIDPNAPVVEEVAEEAEPDVPELLLDPRNLDVAELQQALREHGCNAGIADGLWGERTAGAAQRFTDALGLNIDTSRPNVALFRAVLTAEGDVCGEI